MPLGESALLREEVLVLIYWARAAGFIILARRTDTGGRAARAHTRGNTRRAVVPTGWVDGAREWPRAAVVPIEIHGILRFMSDAR